MAWCRLTSSFMTSSKRTGLRTVMTPSSSSSHHRLDVSASRGLHPGGWTSLHATRTAPSFTRCVPGCLPLPENGMPAAAAVAVEDDATRTNAATRSARAVLDPRRDIVTLPPRVATMGRSDLASGRTFPRFDRRNFRGCQLAFPRFRPVRGIARLRPYRRTAVRTEAIASSARTCPPPRDAREAPSDGRHRGRLLLYDATVLGT